MHQNFQRSFSTWHPRDLSGCALPPSYLMNEAKLRETGMMQKFMLLNNKMKLVRFKIRNVLKKSAGAWPQQPGVAREVLNSSDE